MVHGLRIALEFFSGVIDENDDVRSGAQIILDTARLFSCSKQTPGGTPSFTSPAAHKPWH
jgi:hypothetical protein